jgi:hypothetical protein
MVFSLQVGYHVGPWREASAEEEEEHEKAKLDLSPHGMT